MARSKKEQSLIVTALGVQMTIWQNLVAAVRENGGCDEDIYRLGTPEGKQLIDQMGKLIAESGKVSAEPKTETVTIAGYEFQQITYGDGSRLIELGELEVDSDQSLASKLRVRGFVPHVQAKPGQDTYFTWINQERFPFQQKGRAKKRLALINTGKEAQQAADFADMAERVGRDLCDHAHGLTVEEKYPDLQRELYMIMFGARGFDEDGIPAVLVLASNYESRCLLCNFLGGNFLGGWGGYAWALVSG